MHGFDRVRLETEADEQNGAEEWGPGELEAEYESEQLLDEAEEMELATELLELGGDAEFEDFLGRLFGKVRKRTARALRSKTGRALRRGLRGIARQAVPIAGQAVGSYFGGPIGGLAGSVAAQALGAKLGLELEGLSAEDQEFEVARQFVRLAADAAHAATDLQDSHDPDDAARLAVERAAQRHTPGLVTGAGSQPRHISRRRHTGRWVRRGHSIVLLDI